MVEEHLPDRRQSRNDLHNDVNTFTDITDTMRNFGGTVWILQDIVERSVISVRIYNFLAGCKSTMPSPHRIGKTLQTT
jgi:hypothetical protein